ncbi:MAG: hypothetical protein JWR52_1207 [Marmoricola sp.]|nr:hypothetical protein [Marmoricola sp.]
MTTPVVPRQRREGDTAQARADRTMAELKAGIRVVHAAGTRETDDDGEPRPQA